jgi:DNA-binding HxlR family transcriptional regulator
MNFETGMENLTNMGTDAGECACCAPDPKLIVPFKRAVHAIVGKWKLEILFALMSGPLRFGTLRRSIDGITQHMLTAQLRELEQDSLVRRVCGKTAACGI